MECSGLVEVAMLVFAGFVGDYDIRHGCPEGDGNLRFEQFVACAVSSE